MSLMRLKPDKSTARSNPDGSVHYWTTGPCPTLALIQKCPCPDGVPRSVAVTGYNVAPGRYPGTTHAHQKTVTGFIHQTRSGWMFKPEGKNKDALEEDQ